MEYNRSMVNKIYKIKDLAGAMSTTEPYIRKLIKQGKIDVNKNKEGIQIVDLSKETNKHLIDRIKKKRTENRKKLENPISLENELWKAADSLSLLCFLNSSVHFSSGYFFSFMVIFFSTSSSKSSPSLLATSAR